jgi:2,3-bisphosphoglycerate-independent phosphoglycerate mutase
MQNKKVLLMILDGWGEGDRSRSDVIHNANVPFIRSLYNNPDAAYCRLDPAGLAVGLPEGQMGNSEVGHLNIGAGRVIYQELVRINKACEDRSIRHNKVITDAFSYAIASNKAVHFIGLISDGGVHSTSAQLMALTETASEMGVENIFVHAITDGRDTDPRSGLGFVGEVHEHLQKTGGRIASLIGRYYTMDRDKRWERVKVGYDLMVGGIGKKATDVLQAIEESYNENVTDEFIKPVIITGDNGEPFGLINEGDVVFCFNFRTDRLREITMALSQQDMPEYGMKTLPLYYLTMTRYDESFRDVHIVFDKEDVDKTLGEVISEHGLKQLRIAETEKYPHVTFFFSGGREGEFPGESRILVPSPKVATYDLKPSMSAREVTDAVLTEISKNHFDFICLNYANADMVGHTGIYPAIVEAVETVDACAMRVAQAALRQGYSVIITADHGNADYAINEDGSANTAHSNNKVPCFLIDADYKKMKDGKLADLAPTILTIMQRPVPQEMTGEILVKN